MAYIGRSVDIGMFEKQVLTPDSSTTTFTLTYAVGSANSLLVVYGGVVQEPQVAYSVSGGGQSIAFSEAPATGTTTYIIYLGKQLTTPRAAGQETTKQTFAGDGTTTLFTLTDPPVVPAGIMVFVDGILQREGSGNNYVSSGSTITFTAAPDNGAEIDVYTLVKEKVSIDTVANGSITSAKMAASFPTWDSSGNFTFPLTGSRIRGDFSNATLANRVAFQTSTTNGATVVTAIPNGNSAQSFFTVHNSSDITNSSLGYIAATGTDIRILSTSTGTGTNLPLTFFTGGSERVRIDTSGNVGIGSTQVDGLNLRVSKGLIPGTHSGATDAYGVRVDGSIAAAATNAVRLFSTYPVTTASAFTLSTLTHYQANQGTLGAGSAVTSQYGFQVDTGMVSATNNYGFTATDIGGALATTGKTNIGFYSGLTTASGGGTAWNIYSAGTAPNYFAGNVGIGTTSPTQKLQINNGNIFISSTNWLMWDSNGAFGIQSDASTRLSFFCASGTERMRIDSSGNVGIGISPSYPLHIHAPTGQVYLNSSTGTNFVRYSTNNTGGGFQFGIDNSAGSNFFGATPYGRAIFSDSAYPLGIFTNGTERIRVFADGHVAVNSTATYDAATTMTVGGGSTNVRATSAQFAITRATVSTQYEGINFNTGPSRACFIGRPPNSDDLIIGWDAGSALSEGLRFPSPGGGIKFPATQVASADANTLDDYEEGTFTPNLVNNGTSSTFSAKDGWYRKIGSVVHYWVRFDGGNSGTSGSQLQIVNLPFTFLSGTSAAQVGGVYSSNSPLSATGSVNPQGNTNYANIYSGGGATTAQATYLSAQITAMTTS